MPVSERIAEHFKAQVHFVAQTIDEPNEYEQRYVAFLDVLGFKAIVQNRSSDWIKLNIYDEVRRIHVLFQTDLYSRMLPESTYKKLEFVFISDSIIISIPKKFDRALEVIIAACLFLQKVFLSKTNTILLRGAISQGDYFHFEQITFGQALVDAYIEEKRAQFPRILIDERISVLSNCIEKESIGKVFCSCDEDGEQYIDYLKMTVGFSTGVHDDLKRIRSYIQENIELYKLEERTLPKFKWLASHFNYNLSFFFADKHPELVRRFSVIIH